MSQHLGLVCGCDECHAHGVATEPQRRIPAASGGSRWIHGRELRRWLDARAAFVQAARAAVGAPGRHQRMERLVQVAQEARS